MNWLLVVLRFLVETLLREFGRLQPVLARCDGRTVNCRVETDSTWDGTVRGKQLVIGMAVRGSCFLLNVCQLVPSIGSWARNPKKRDSWAVCGMARAGGRYK